MQTDRRKENVERTNGRNPGKAQLSKQTRNFVRKSNVLGRTGALGEEKKNMYNVIWKDKYGEIIIAEDFDNGSNIDVVVRGEEK